jgi:hypothetical protein
LEHFRKRFTTFVAAGSSLFRVAETGSCLSMNHEEAIVNRPVSLDSFLASYPSERDRDIRPLALWPLLLVVAIAAFIVWSSDSTLPPDQYMASPYLQVGMAP